MSIALNILAIWSPVTKHTSKISCTLLSYQVRKITKKLSSSIWFSLIYVMTFLYYAVSKPVLIILVLGKTNLEHEQNSRKNIRDEDTQIYEEKILQLLRPLLFCQNELNCGSD